MTRRTDGPGGRPTLHAPSEVNPYTRHLHEHPGVLLAEPTPRALAALLADKETTTVRVGGGRPVIVDLGCGSGNFLLELAPAHPEASLVGFELRYKRLVKAARKIERAGLDNVCLVRDYAERLPVYFGPGALTGIHLNFPDPWPKPSQWKHRLVSPAFLAEVERLLRPGGRFHFKTDHSGYFLHVLSLLPQAKGLRIGAFHNDVERGGLPGVAPRSEFEMLFRSRRRPIFYLALDKPTSNG